MTNKLADPAPQPFWPTLLGKGHAYIVGLPRDFDLGQVLCTAKAIRLATAFAHRGGWRHFRTGISDGNASVYLLTGLEFFQTEPELLKEWLELKLTHGDRIEPRLAADDSFFHPKVLIVTPQNDCSTFAVVGSGNLSQGGLSSNTECSLYTADPAAVRELASWFDVQFKAGVPLTPGEIKVYKNSYKKNRELRRKLEGETKKTAKKLTTIGQAVMTSWTRAVGEAKKYFQSTEFETDYKTWRNGADQILKALQFPDFNFDRSGWNQFYAVGPLGRLDPRYRDKVFQNVTRVRRALRSLRANAEKALPLVLERRRSLHVTGLGLNTVSKILAVFDPINWPVFNGPVAAALADFGYVAPRGKGPVGKYLAYRNAMKRFMTECGAIDTIALDAFFYYWFRRIAKDHSAKQ